MEWAWVGGWLFRLLMLAGMILLVVLAVRVLGDGITRGLGAAGSPAQSPGRSQAREVLDERYARGEITTEEYRERLQTLGDA
jgi:putative membrane protein